MQRKEIHGEKRGFRENICDRVNIKVYTGSPDNKIKINNCREELFRMERRISEKATHNYIRKIKPGSKFIDKHIKGFPAFRK